MTDKRPLDEAQLDALFFAAAQDRPTPSDDLMARIMADAEAEIAAASIPAAVTSAPTGFANPGLSIWTALQSPKMKPPVRKKGCNRPHEQPR